MIHNALCECASLNCRHFVVTHLQQICIATTVTQWLVRDASFTTASTRKTMVTYHTWRGFLMDISSTSTILRPILHYNPLLGWHSGWASTTLLSAAWRHCHAMAWNRVSPSHHGNEHAALYPQGFCGPSSGPWQKHIMFPWFGLFRVPASK